MKFDSFKANIRLYSIFSGILSAFYFYVSDVTFGVIWFILCWVICFFDTADLWRKK